MLYRIQIRVSTSAAYDGFFWKDYFRFLLSFFFFTAWSTISVSGNGARDRREIRELVNSFTNELLYKLCCFLQTLQKPGRCKKIWMRLFLMKPFLWSDNHCGLCSLTATETTDPWAMFHAHVIAWEWLLLFFSFLRGRRHRVVVVVLKMSFKCIPFSVPSVNQ